MAEGRDTTPKIIDRLQWREAENARRKVDSSYGAVVASSTTVYFYHMSDEICAYDTRSNQWTSIPSPPKIGYSLTLILSTINLLP